MSRWKRLLARPVSVAALIECGLLLALVYIVLGTAWLFTHYDTVAEFQAQWVDLVPRFGELAGFAIAFLLWPVLLLLPTTCILPWA